MELNGSMSAAATAIPIVSNITPINMIKNNKMTAATKFTLLNENSEKILKPMAKTKVKIVIFKIHP
jgi:hypothetical protein